MHHATCQQGHRLPRLGVVFLAALALGLPARAQEDEVLRVTRSAYERAGRAPYPKELLNIVEDLEAVVRRHPHSPHRHWARATAAAWCTECRDYARAEAILNEGLSDAGIPPKMRAQFMEALAKLGVAQGDIDLALKQVDAAKRYAYDQWLSRAGGDIPDANSEKDRSDKAHKAYEQILFFIAGASRIWKRAGRQDLTARAWLDLAASQRELITSQDDFAKRRAAGLMSEALFNAADEFLRAGQREEARLAIEQALPLMDCLPTKNPERAPAIRFKVGVRAAWLRGDREETRRVLKKYAGRYWMPMFCNSFAHYLPAADRIEFLREVLPLIPEDLATNIRAFEDLGAINAEPFLYRMAIDTAYELGLDDEAAKYVKALGERYPDESTTGLLGPLEPSLQRYTQDRSVGGKASATRRPAPSSPPSSRSHYIYTPPAKEPSESAQVADAATPSTQATSSPAVARIPDVPIRQDGPEARPAERTPPRKSTDFLDASVSRNTRMFAVLAAVFLCAAVYAALRRKKSRAGRA